MEPVKRPAFVRACSAALALGALGAAPTSALSRDIDLRMDALPSAQGFTYAGAPNESDVFSVDGTSLRVDSRGVGANDSFYFFPDLIDPSLPFEIEVTVRVTESNNYWLDLFVSAFPGNGDVFGLRAGRNFAFTGNGTLPPYPPVNGESFHTYRLEGLAGVHYALYVDGALVQSGVPLPDAAGCSGVSCNELLFGPNNCPLCESMGTVLEITRLRFAQRDAPRLRIGKLVLAQVVPHEVAASQGAPSAAAPIALAMGVPAAAIATIEAPVSQLPLPVTVRAALAGTENHEDLVLTEPRVEVPLVLAPERIGQGQLEVEVLRSGDAGPPADRRAADVMVVDTGRLNLIFVEITPPACGGAPCYPRVADAGYQVAQSMRFLERVFPFHRENLRVFTFALPGEAEEPGFVPGPRQVPPGELADIIHLCELYQSARPSLPNESLLVVGIVGDERSWPGGCSQGYFSYHYGRRCGDLRRLKGQAESRVPAIVAEGFWTEAAHELGHTLGIDWRPPGDPVVPEDYTCTREAPLCRPGEGYLVDGYWIDLPRSVTHFDRRVVDFMGTAPLAPNLGPPPVDETFRWISPGLWHYLIGQFPSGEAQLLCQPREAHPGGSGGCATGGRGGIASVSVLLLLLWRLPSTRHPPGRTQSPCRGAHDECHPSDCRQRSSSHAPTRGAKSWIAPPGIGAGS